MASSLKNFSKKKIKLQRRTKVFFRRSNDLALEGKLQLHRHWRVAPDHREIYGSLLQNLTKFHSLLLSNSMVLLVNVFPRNGLQLREFRTYLDTNSLTHRLLTKKVLSIWKRLGLPVNYFFNLRSGGQVFVLFPTDAKQLCGLFQEPFLGRYGRYAIPFLLRLNGESLAVHRFKAMERTLLSGPVAVYESILPTRGRWQFLLQRWHSLLKTQISS